MERNFLFIDMHGDSGRECGAAVLAVVGGAWSSPVHEESHSFFHSHVRSSQACERSDEIMCFTDQESEAESKLAAATQPCYS